MLPLDLILVRHGQSEGNVANKASRKGDNGFFTDEFLDRHSRDFRLTDKGIWQAGQAGIWLRANVVLPLDRYYVSDYVRAKETAYLLNLPGALWRREFHLRERDMALMDNIPQHVREEQFAKEHRAFQQDPFLSYPAGGGESFAAHCFRMKGTMLEHWARECADKRVIAVCHGHVMRALQVEIEDLSHDDFIRLDASEDPREKMRNCQILWYSRTDPITGTRGTNMVAVRTVCPWDSDGDYGWRRLTKKRYTNEDLRAEVESYPRHIAGCEAK